MLNFQEALSTGNWKPRTDGHYASMAGVGYLVMAICGTVIIHASQQIEYSIHPRCSEKMYQGFKGHENQKTIRFVGLQLEIPQWSGDNIHDDFVTKLLTSSHGHKNDGEFEVGDKVMLKVSPWKGCGLCIGKRGGEIKSQVCWTFQEFTWNAKSIPKKSPNMLSKDGPSSSAASLSLEDMAH
ncbi:hypothetical protein Tco_0533338 [Tanacetum coccineum]